MDKEAVEKDSTHPFPVPQTTQEENTNKNKPITPTITTTTTDEPALSSSSPPRKNSLAKSFFSPRLTASRKGLRKALETGALGGDSDSKEDGIPAPKYTLEKLLLSPSMGVVSALVHSVSAKVYDDLASALLTVFHANGKGQRLIIWAIDKELKVEKKPTTLFRGLSLAATLMSRYFQISASEYLKSVMKPFLKELKSKHVDIEVDPAKLPKGGDNTTTLLANQARLREYCQKLFDIIVESIDRFPTSLKTIFHFAQQTILERFPEMGYQLVGGFFFLRFLCPALVAPTAYKLQDTEPTPEVHRSLVLISKVLQNLSNDVRFGQKEAFMMFMNDFLAANSDAMRDCLQTLAAQQPILPFSVEVEHHKNNRSASFIKNGTEMVMNGISTLGRKDVAVIKEEKKKEEALIYLTKVIYRYLQPVLTNLKSTNQTKIEGLLMEALSHMNTLYRDVLPTVPLPPEDDYPQRPKRALTSVGTMGRASSAPGRATALTSLNALPAFSFQKNSTSSLDVRKDQQKRRERSKSNSPSHSPAVSPRGDNNANNNSNSNVNNSNNVELAKKTRTTSRRSLLKRATSSSSNTAGLLTGGVAFLSPASATSTASSSPMSSSSSSPAVSPLPSPTFAPASLTSSSVTTFLEPLDNTGSSNSSKLSKTRSRAISSLSLVSPRRPKPTVPLSHDSNNNHAHNAMKGPELVLRSERVPQTMSADGGAMTNRDDTRLRLLKEVLLEETMRRKEVEEMLEMEQNTRLALEQRLRDEHRWKRSLCMLWLMRGDPGWEEQMEEMMQSINPGSLIDGDEDDIGGDVGLDRAVAGTETAAVAAELDGEEIGEEDELVMMIPSSSSFHSSQSQQENGNLTTITMMGNHRSGDGGARQNRSMTTDMSFRPKLIRHNSSSQTSQLRLQRRNSATSTKNLLLPTSSSSPSTQQDNDTASRYQHSSSNDKDYSPIKKDKKEKKRRGNGKDNKDTTNPSERRSHSQKHHGVNKKEKKESKDKSGSKDRRRSRALPSDEDDPLLLG
ncbi:Neurofibromin 1 [Balamuthia mandrillaris]